MSSVPGGLPVGSLPYDAYVQVSDHPGESDDSAHVGWIEIKQFIHNIDQKIAASFSASGAPTSGQADHSYFWICKEVDKSSPKLLLSCLQGTSIDEVLLEICTQAGEKTTYLRIKLNKVVVAAVHTIAGPNPPEAESLTISKPCEWVGFAYGQYEQTYTEMDHETGAVKGDIVSHWDRKANKGG